MAALNRFSPRLLVWLVVGYVVFWSCVVGVIAYQTRETRRAQTTLSESNNRALCALRQDLERRLAASSRFLADHPEGIPGIPRAVIVQGMVNQQSTVHALVFLDCEAS